MVYSVIGKRGETVDVLRVGQCAGISVGFDTTRNYKFRWITFLIMALTEREENERIRLMNLQRQTARFFTREEFDRLNKLHEKAYGNSGGPHDATES